MSGSEEQRQPDVLIARIGELEERLDDLEELVNEQTKLIDYQSVAIRRMGFP